MGFLQAKYGHFPSKNGKPWHFARQKRPKMVKHGKFQGKKERQKMDKNGHFPRKWQKTIKNGTFQGTNGPKLAIWMTKIVKNGTFQGRHGKKWHFYW